MVNVKIEHNKQHLGSDYTRALGSIDRRFYGWAYVDGRRVGIVDDVVTNDSVHKHVRYEFRPDNIGEMCKETGLSWVAFIDNGRTLADLKRAIAMRY